MNQRTRIKICGLTREADVDAAVEAGADAIGFVLYDKSPRVRPQILIRVRWFIVRRLAQGSQSMAALRSGMPWTGS